MTPTTGKLQEQETGLLARFYASPSVPGEYPRRMPSRPRPPGPGDVDFRQQKNGQAPCASGFCGSRGVRTVVCLLGLWRVVLRMSAKTVMGSRSRREQRVTAARPRKSLLRRDKWDRRLRRVGNPRRARLLWRIRMLRIRRTDFWWANDASCDPRSRGRRPSKGGLFFRRRTQLFGGRPGLLAFSGSHQLRFRRSLPAWPYPP